MTEQTLPAEHGLAELLRAAPGADIGDVEHVERCLLTGGPSWTILNLTTGRRMTVAYEPTLGTYNVFCRGNSWSSVRPDRLREAVRDVRGTWADYWSAEREGTAS